MLFYASRAIAIISSAVKHKSIAIAPWQSQTLPSSLFTNIYFADYNPANHS
ncbi:MAG: hypothetical protein V7K98_24030 [Nostoc sp.]|uniref:hypothetical protein n=1 Tax=Nostoc sp. TaxID=1180 RepID=UPI002FF58636